MSNKLELISRVIENHYSTEDYPSLGCQIETWSVSKPLEGVRILDSTPIFRNTMVKYMALLAAGADLTVGVSEIILNDIQIIDFLKQIGIKVVDSHSADTQYDIILDCAGAFSHIDATLGYVELTRSGVAMYEGCQKPVFVVDSGAIKRIETLLGTGESLFRALGSLGYNDWKTKRIVLFGSGKVGSGIVINGIVQGADMVVITDLESINDHIATKCSAVIDYRDIQSVCRAIESADLVVCATGIKGVISSQKVASSMTNSRALLANMGAEDEFGDLIPDERVLMNKKTINFILDEPTHLCYIETTMALHNFGALYIKHNPESRGIITPPHDIEQDLLSITRSRGRISEQLSQL